MQTKLTALSLLEQYAYYWRVLLEEIADTGWKTLLPTVDHPRVNHVVEFWKQVYEMAPDQSAVPTWFLAVLHKLQDQPAAPPQSPSKISTCIGHLKLAAGRDHPRHLVKTWWHLLQATQLPLLQVLELWNLEQLELESAVLEFDNLRAAHCTNAKEGFALLTRCNRISALTQDVQKLADQLEYEFKHKIVTMQHPLICVLARKIRLVTVWHLLMTKRQPREPDVVRSHLAVQHTKAMFSHIRSSITAKTTLQAVNQSRFIAVAVRGLLHQHRASLHETLDLHHYSIQLHQAHLALTWQIQMVTNIQQARFGLIYQQLRAQTRASEQWEEVHQISDTMVKLLDIDPKDRCSDTWHSCKEVGPFITGKVKLAAKRHRRKAKEAVQKAVQAAKAEIHLHAPIGGYSGMQQRAKLPAWQVWLSRIKRGYLVGMECREKCTFKSETRFAPLLILSRRLVSV